jgi:hypothetical protein
MRNGYIVVPHRGASSTGVGTAAARPRRETRARDVVEVRILEFGEKEVRGWDETNADESRTSTVNLI